MEQFRSKPFQATRIELGAEVQKFKRARVFSYTHQNHSHTYESSYIYAIMKLLETAELL